MHTIYVIGGGLVLLALFVIVARAGNRRFASLLRWYWGAWLVATLINLWVGVTQAGYTVAEELPIQLVVFAVPAAIAWLVARKL